VEHNSLHKSIMQKHCTSHQQIFIIKSITVILSSSNWISAVLCTELICLRVQSKRTHADMNTHSHAERGNGSTSAVCVRLWLQFSDQPKYKLTQAHCTQRDGKKHTHSHVEKEFRRGAHMQVTHFMIRNKTENHPSYLCISATLVFPCVSAPPPPPPPPQFIAPSGCVKCCSVGVLAQNTSKTYSWHTRTQSSVRTHARHCSLMKSGGGGGHFCPDYLFGRSESEGVKRADKGGRESDGGRSEMEGGVPAAAKPRWSNGEKNSVWPEVTNRVPPERIDSSVFRVSVIQ